MSNTNKDVFLLREKPKLEVTILEEEFQITDESKGQKIESFKYRDINALLFQPRKIDWLTTAISILVGYFFMESSLGTLKKNKAMIRFNQGNEEREIPLGNCNNRVIHKLYSRLQFKLTANQRAL